MKPELCNVAVLKTSTSFVKNPLSKALSKTAAAKHVAAQYRRAALRNAASIAGLLGAALLGMTQPANAETAPKSVTCDQLKPVISRVVEQTSAVPVKVTDVAFTYGSFEKDGHLICYADVTSDRGVVLGSYWVFNQKDGTIVRRWDPFWPVNPSKK